MKANGTLSFADALGEVHKVHPELYTQYHDERFKPLRK